MNHIFGSKNTCNTEFEYGLGIEWLGLKEGFSFMSFERWVSYLNQWNLGGVSSISLPEKNMQSSIPQNLHVFEIG
jgi:hypothetical protein